MNRTPDDVQTSVVAAVDKVLAHEPHRHVRLIVDIVRDRRMIEDIRGNRSLDNPRQVADDAINVNADDVAVTVREVLLEMRQADPLPDRNVVGAIVDAVMRATFDMMERAGACDPEDRLRMASGRPMAMAGLTTVAMMRLREGRNMMEAA